MYAVSRHEKFFPPWLETCSLCFQEVFRHFSGSLGLIVLFAIVLTVFTAPALALR